MSEAQNIDEYYPNKNDSGPLYEDLKNHEITPIQSEDSFQINEAIQKNLDKDNNGNNDLDKDKQKEMDTYIKIISIISRKHWL